MRKIFVFVLAATLCFALVNVVSVRADAGDGSGVDSYLTSIPDEGLIPSENTTVTLGNAVTQVNLPFSTLYVPWTIVLTFAQTDSRSVEINGTLHTDSQVFMTTPTMTFGSQDMDTYTIHAAVSYDGWVNQTVSITLLGGGNESIVLSQPIEVSMYSRGFVLRAVVNSVRAPHYPTPQEMWDYGTGQQQEMLATMKGDIEGQQGVQWMVLVVVLALALASAVCIAVLFGHALRERVRLARIERSGYGGNQ